MGNPLNSKWSIYIMCFFLTGITGIVEKLAENQLGVSVTAGPFGLQKIRGYMVLQTR